MIRTLSYAMIAGAGIVAIAPSAEAQTYARAGLTVATTEDLGEAIGVEGAFGYDFGAVRGEISADYFTGFAVQSYTQGEFTTAETDATVMSAFVSLYYDFDAMGGWTPYVGAGVGGALVDPDDAAFSTPGGFTGSFAADTETEFAWHAGGGLTFSAGPGMLVDVGYRYVDLGDARFVGNASTSNPGPPPTASAIDASEIPGSATSHQLRLTLRFGG